ncbi:DUF302 domain-containing protein [Halothiobacillus sp. DCM-1]|uniref:DUF302 domain-containing protein n=1 Tax=Halothiobacillus sp. DCM-1 TaxID=3112558 RepID=UPI003243B831
MSAISFFTTVNLPVPEAIEQVTAALKTEGFGVLTTIDVAATLKAKLGIEQPPYVILGACNPQFAHQAIQQEPEIGVLLPCNVVVRADGEGRSIVSFMDPTAVLCLVDHPDVVTLGNAVRERLQRVAAALG